MERDQGYESRFLPIAELAELDEIKNHFRENHLLYAPNSIYHGVQGLGSRLPLSEEASLRVEIGRLNDFISFLFSDKEYCDHANESEAWDEFEQWEYSQLLNSEPEAQECDATRMP